MDLIPGGGGVIWGKKVDPMEPLAQVGCLQTLPMATGLAKNI